jgi:hypothetical protein
MNGILDLSPIEPPRLGTQPAGNREDFVQLLSDGGLPNVVSTNSWPHVRVHGGPFDFKVVTPGQVIYCVAGSKLPADTTARALEIVRRLAYGFHDWAAREVVSRYHRDMKRSTVETSVERTTIPASVRIRRFLRSNPGATVGQIAQATGVAQPNVSRTIAGWIEQGTASSDRSGRETRCSLLTLSQEPTPTEGQPPQMRR